MPCTPPRAPPPQLQHDIAAAHYGCGAPENNAPWRACSRPAGRPAEASGRPDTDPDSAIGPIAAVRIGARIARSTRPCSGNRNGKYRRRVSPQTPDRAPQIHDRSCLQLVVCPAGEDQKMIVGDGGVPRRRRGSARRDLVEGMDGEGPCRRSQAGDRQARSVARGVTPRPCPRGAPRGSARSSHATGALRIRPSMARRRHSASSAAVARYLRRESHPLGERHGS